MPLARTLTCHARFVSPEIVRAIVEDNEKWRADWLEALNARGVPAAAYLWEGSPCAFPGVRRYAGSHEQANFHGHVKDRRLPQDVLALDDNDYPKQLWSYLYLGKQFPKHGPPGYHLAHLADHKDHQNRAGEDFEHVPAEGVSGRLHGLYTCPTNTIYLPEGFLKPTDFHPKVRSLFIRKSQALYGSYCHIVPPPLTAPACKDERWDIDAFEWADPVGESRYLSTFLDFRAKRVVELMAKKPVLGGASR